MMAMLRRNFGYKVLSLAIAILLYYVASAQQNPRIPREIVVQPELINVPADLVLKEPPRPVSVTVSGLASTINALRPQAVRATADATTARYGINRLPITYVFPPNVHAEPGPDALFTEVSLDKKVSFPYGVDVVFSGTAPVGYEYGDRIPDPAQVNIVGPEETVKRVVRVAARLEKGDDEGAIDRTVTLIPEDKEKRVVDGVELRPAQAHVRIGLKPLPATKNMLLSARIEGEPEPGYVVRTYDFEPKSVTLVGAPDLLSSRSSIEVPVDISGVSGRGIVTRTVKVTPPSGLRLHAAETVRVHLAVVPVAPAVGNSPSPGSTPAAPASRPAASPTPEPDTTR